MNEAKDIDDLFQDIVECATAMRYVNRATRSHSARIFASIRTESLSALETPLAMLSGSLFCAFSPDQMDTSIGTTESTLPQPFFQLLPFTEMETKNAYEKYQATGTRVCPVLWEQLPRETRALLRQPLLLRIFHVTFADSNSPSPLIGLHSLWDRYLSSIVSLHPPLGPAIELISGVCLMKGAADPTQPVLNRFLDLWEAKARLDYRLPRDGTAILCSLVDEGLVRRTESGDWLWSSESLAEQLFHRAFLVEDPQVYRSSIERWVEQLPQTPLRDGALALTAVALWNSDRLADLAPIKITAVWARLFALTIPSAQVDENSEALFFNRLKAIVEPLIVEGDWDSCMVISKALRILCDSLWKHAGANILLLVPVQLRARLLERCLELDKRLGEDGVFSTYSDVFSAYIWLATHWARENPTLAVQYGEHHLDICMRYEQYFSTRAICSCSRALGYLIISNAYFASGRKPEAVSIYGWPLSSLVNQ